MTDSHLSQELVTCPKCQLMAHHYEQLVTPKPRRDIEIRLWGSTEPLEALPFNRLTCMFCEHKWVELDL